MNPIYQEKKAIYYAHLVNITQKNVKYHKVLSYSNMSKAKFSYVSLKEYFILKNTEAHKICSKNNYACLKFLLKKSIKDLK